MRILLKPNILSQLQNQLKMTDQEFAEYIGVSRSQLWRAQLPSSDKRFSLGQDFMAKILAKTNKNFYDVFFLEGVSHECDNINSA